MTYYTPLPRVTGKELLARAKVEGYALPPTYKNWLMTKLPAYTAQDIGNLRMNTWDWMWCILHTSMLPEYMLHWIAISAARRAFSLVDFDTTELERLLAVKEVWVDELLSRTGEPTIDYHGIMAYPHDLPLFEAQNRAFALSRSPEWGYRKVEEFCVMVKERRLLWLTSILRTTLLFSPNLACFDVIHQYACFADAILPEKVYKVEADWLPRMVSRHIYPLLQADRDVRSAVASI